MKTLDELKKRREELEEIIDSLGLDDNSTVILEPSAELDFLNQLMDEYHEVLDLLSEAFFDEYSNKDISEDLGY